MRTLLMLGVLCLGPTLARGDTFDRLNSAALEEAGEGQPQEKLSMQQAAKLKPLPGAESPCVVVKTSEGNWSKVLVSWQFKRAGEKPMPVLLVERFVTFNKGGKDIAAAADKNVMLFGGFSYDLDIGQVVPDQLGGDLQFQASGELKPINGAQLFMLDVSKLPGAAAGVKPSASEQVVPADYSGTWTVNADGRWTGTWTLTVDDNGACKGEFLSDETKSLYVVSGKVTPGQTNRIKLNVELANTTQAFDAYLWSKDKSAMAGTLQLAGKTFGFYAVRKTEK